jgi:hypothetical protein
MKRRDFITLLGGAAAAWPLAARAQQPDRVRRIGIVMPYAKGDSEIEARVRAFRQELGKLGWIDGGNVQLDERWTTDNMDSIRAHAASLVASNPDIIVATSRELFGALPSNRGILYAMIAVPAITLPCNDRVGKRNDTTRLCDCTGRGPLSGRDPIIKRACGRRLNRLETSEVGLCGCLGLTP